MMSLSRLMWRLIAVGVGFVAAVLASIVVVIAGLGVFAAGEHVATAPDAVGLLGLVTSVMRGAVIAPVLATVVWPAWFLAGIVAEILGVRKLWVHLLAAMVIAVVGVVGSLPLVGLAHVQSTAAAGLVAGFVHWLIAGRSAGFMTRAVPAAMVEGDARPPHA